MNKVEVRQADRDAFRSIILGGDTEQMIAKMLEEGAWDDDPRMLGIARHRQAAYNQALKDAADLIHKNWVPDTALRVAKDILSLGDKDNG